MHNAQALLATTPFGVGGRAHETPGSPQTGNLGLFSTTPLALHRGRPGDFPQCGWRCLVNAWRFFTTRLALHRGRLAIFDSAVGVAS